MVDTSVPSSSRGSPACSICGDAGWLRLDVPVNDPRFGKIVPCACQKAQREHEHSERLFALSRLGERQRSMTFQSFYTQDIPYEHVDGRTPHALTEIYRSLKQAKDAAQAYTEEPNGWLVLIGDTGCGKTHLAVAICNERIRRGEPVLFQVVPDLLDHLRAAYAPTSTVTYDDLFEAVQTAPLLVLDDLGAQSSSQWAQEKLFQIVNFRYNHRLPTIVTTNVPPERLDQRLASRMLDRGSIIIGIRAPDFRGETTRSAEQRRIPGQRLRNGRSQ
ncbi:MAG: ATP-binding protein [Chloroflexi bacterium]|nr:ATP-binding protein [Chloroflexota bacterium]